ncbi:MAG: UTP--glucose-1-phosphate uridylyltransferase GalU [Alphaproteobacteria bacterium]|jgi:UTP--glucose-1-phosphate uridylyltransferase|nr:UTP--glucose-1-phosphate uridylyltransferase GalU [Alphaproteobacteria bacterium]
MANSATGVRKAVFPVAGLGTRFLPATKAVPKEMLPVVDKPLIQYAVEEAAAAGIEEFIFVTAEGKQAIRAHFEPAEGLEAVLADGGKTDILEAVRTVIPDGAKFDYVIQDQPLGLGHAVWCAKELVGDEPFAVLLPDDLVMAETPCLAQLVAAQAETGGNVVAVEEVPRDQTRRYGVLDIEADDGRLAAAKGLVEKPDPADAPSRLAIIGRYVLLPEIFDHLAQFEAGAGGEIQLTDAMAKTIGSAPFHGLRFEGRRFDCGNTAGFLEANVAFALRREDLAPAVREMLAGWRET